MNEKIKNKNGITLIVLIITIIVIILLAGTTVLIVLTSDPITESKRTVMMQKGDNYRAELALNISSEILQNKTKKIIDFDISGEDVYKYIPTLKEEKIDGKELIEYFEIVDGNLVLKSSYDFSKLSQNAKLKLNYIINPEDEKSIKDKLGIKEE